MLQQGAILPYVILMRHIHSNPCTATTVTSQESCEICRGQGTGSDHAVCRYTFRDLTLLKQAFMCPGALENDSSNRPLAYFGDVALTMIVMEGIATRLAR